MIEHPNRWRIPGVVYPDHWRDVPGVKYPRMVINNSAIARLKTQKHNVVVDWNRASHGEVRAMTPAQRRKHKADYARAYRKALKANRNAQAQA